MVLGSQLVGLGFEFCFLGPRVLDQCVSILPYGI